MRRFCWEIGAWTSQPKRAPESCKIQALEGRAHHKLRGQGGIVHEAGIQESSGPGNLFKATK